MYPFTFTQASDIPTAIADSGGHPDNRFLAGGTTLIDLMKLDVERPGRLIDITSVPLNKVTDTANGVRIGALVTNADLAHHPLIVQRYPVLSQAILAGASPQLRNMATTGGNILQRTRCYYFRDTSMPCNKRDPGSGCSAMDGFNRIHAVLGTSSHCIATNPSDMCVAMAALDAVVVLQSAAGERRVNLTDFHVVPGDHPEIETVLRAGEIITAVELPSLPFATHSRYRKVRDRASYAFALSSAAVALDIDHGTIRQARLALGGVGTKPWRCFESEKEMIGKPATPDIFHSAAEKAMLGARTRKNNAFKVELAKRVIVRTLTEASVMA